jgi:hypothetical protein
MSPPARALYRGLWRQVRRFQGDALPITGVVGLDAGPVCIDPLARLRAAFEAGSGGSGGGGSAHSSNHQNAALSAGLQALRALPQQAAALAHADEDARALLARWAQLQARWAELRRQHGRWQPARQHKGGGGDEQQQPQQQPRQRRRPRPFPDTRVLEAAEEACALAYAATEEEAAERALDDDEAEERRERARRVLSLARPPQSEAGADLASRARRAVASAASSTPHSLEARYPSVRVRQAAAASAALFAYSDSDRDGGGGGGGRLRSEPVEWLYDGIEAALPQPLLVGDLLPTSEDAAAASAAAAAATSSGPPTRAARKGVPLALALTAARCLADVALPGVTRYEPVCARDHEAEMLATGQAEQGGSSSSSRGGGGGAAGNLSALPAAVAARQAGRTVAVAPSTNTWLVRLDIAVGGGGEGAAEHGGGGDNGGEEHEEEEGEEAWFVDVTRKGELLSRAEAEARYPALASEGKHVHGPEGALEEERATLALWREVARTLVLAHQRRGEADSVAAWMNAAMALDPSAAEWRVVAGGGAM